MKRQLLVINQKKSPRGTPKLLTAAQRIAARVALNCPSKSWERQAIAGVSLLCSTVIHADPPYHLQGNSVQDNDGNELAFKTDSSVNYSGEAASAGSWWNSLSYVYVHVDNVNGWVSFYDDWQVPWVDDYGHFAGSNFGSTIMMNGYHLTPGAQFENYRTCVAAHELGHSLGIDHCEQNDSLMYDTPPDVSSFGHAAEDYYVTWGS